MKPRRVAAVLAAAACVSCSGTKATRAPFPRAYSAQGEEIRVVQKSGATHKTSFVLVDRDTIRFNGQAMEVFEIDRIVTREFSPGKTALLTGSLAVGALGALYWLGVSTGEGPFSGAKTK